MSVTLATVADALIEFILSLLRDPEAAAEFDADPEAAIAGKGLSGIRPQDVCAVAPVVAEAAHVAPHHGGPNPGPPHPEPDPVIREIKSIINNFAWVDDRDTIVDQSVNQNIWAHGDVTQIFDNEANVASGDEAIAAGDDVDIDTTYDESTDIEAGDDVNIGNDTDTSIVDDSYNEATDASTNVDESTTVHTDGSFNDSSTDVEADDSFNDTTDTYTETDVDVDANVVVDSTETVIVDDVTADDQL